MAHLEVPAAAQYALLQPVLAAAKGNLEKEDEMPVIETKTPLDGFNEKIKSLAKAISESPEFIAFEEAKKKMRENEEAQKLIREFKDKQRTFQMFGGFVNPRAQTELKQCQRRMLANPEIQNYFKKQEDLAEFLRDIGKVISENAGFDFSQACTPATGCC